MDISARNETITRNGEAIPRNWFRAGLSGASTARVAAREALERAGVSPPPRIALVFGSVSYPDLAEVAAVISDALGRDVPVAGASAGGAIFSGDQVLRHGVLVVLLGGDDVAVSVESVGPLTGGLGHAHDAAARLRPFWRTSSQRGLRESMVLILATPFAVDAGALVESVRQGAGTEAQLAGGLAGDDLRFERAAVFAGRQILSDGVVLVGIATARSVGIGVRHGWRPVSRWLKVTKASGAVLEELEGRPALDVWVEEVQRAGGHPNSVTREKLLQYLFGEWELGVGVDGKEPIVRAPFEILPGGAVRLASALKPGVSVRVMHARRDNLLRAAAESARLAQTRVGARSVGSLVFSCSGRLALLGDDFRDEVTALAGTQPQPVAGFCTYGEFARSHEHVDAFHNTTCVTVALPG